MYLRLCKYSALLFFILSGVVAVSATFRQAGVFVVLFFISWAFYFAGHDRFKSFSFTSWVFAFVAMSMFYPNVFGVWIGYDLKGLIVPLIQIIMFGMGATLSVRDFSRILVMPWPVLVGMILQFTIMPFTGFALATVFGFEPEVAAGLILIGACPGGVASNVMTYLAGGNVALSVTMTACSTMMSPVMTPLMFQLLAGQLVPVDFMAMMLSIFNMIIVPVVAGLISNKILYSPHRRYNTAAALWILIFSSLIAVVLLSMIPLNRLGVFVSLRDGTLIGLILIALVALVKWIFAIRLQRQDRWLDKTLPIISMTAICFIIAIITARSSEKLLSVGPLLLTAAMAHNLIGYLLGYWLSKPLRLNEADCRTVAIEVGMQNGGMASGLAMEVLKSAHVALAPAIFGPWQNISGSILASWWSRKPAEMKPHSK